jgi:membrane-associated phospholipid phosphatase
MVKRRTVLLLVGMAAALPVQAGAASGWDEAGTIGRDILVAGALGLPALEGDWKGDLQAGISLGAAFLATEALKQAFPSRRPDGSDRRSFPSGHTSLSFAAAATLQNRYGWQIGLPAQLLAAAVGGSRVAAGKHHWYDVAVGAAIGEASGLLLTSRRDPRVRLVPWGSVSGAGAALAFRF